MTWSSGWGGRRFWRWLGVARVGVTVLGALRCFQTARRAPVPPRVAVGVSENGWIWVAQVQPAGLRLVVSRPQARQSTVWFRWHVGAHWFGDGGWLRPVGPASEDRWRLSTDAAVPSEWSAWHLPRTAATAAAGRACTAEFCPRSAVPSASGSLPRRD